MGNALGTDGIDQKQGIIIGSIIGGIFFIIITIVIVICCCCRKAERSCFKRAMRRLDKKHNAEKSVMTAAQDARREEMNKRHQEIRDKYNLNGSSVNNGISSVNIDMQQTKYAVENEEIGFSIR